MYLNVNVQQRLPLAVTHIYEKRLREGLTATQPKWWISISLPRTWNITWSVCELPETLTSLFQFQMVRPYREIKDILLTYIEHLMFWLALRGPVKRIFSKEYLPGLPIKQHLSYHRFLLSLKGKKIKPWHSYFPLGTRNMRKYHRPADRCWGINTLNFNIVQLLKL